MNHLSIKKISIVSMLAVSALVSSICSAETLPAPIQSAVASGLKFEKSFPAAGGLTGWVLSQGPGTNMVLFTTAVGDVAIAGNMFDAKGVNLTKQYLEKYSPKPDYEKLWGELDSSAWVSEGASTKDAKSVVYAFEDANCGYCHLAWKAFQPYMAVGLQVRWVPVAFLAADSMPKAVQLLGASSSSAAITEMHADFGKKLTSTKPLDEALKAKVENNAKIMRKYGFSGTPAIFYKDKQGIVHAVNGMPSLSELPSITGLPEQENKDSSLARYR